MEAVCESLPENLNGTCKAEDCPEEQCMSHEPMEQPGMVDVSKLTSALAQSHSMLNSLHVIGAQAHLLVDIKNALSYVNNELVKVQNALSDSTQK